MTVAGFDLPPEPHVPGRNARPEPALFAAARATARPGMSEEALARCAAWVAGHECYRAGYFWEAHELWEPVWMAAAPNSRARAMAGAAIQLANAALKLRMGRTGAARRLLAIVSAQAAALGEAPALGQEADWLHKEVERLGLEVGT